ncbi:MAG: PD-(D/E)XK nuclease family protein [Acidimicrobiales bacterium]
MPGRVELVCPCAEAEEALVAAIRRAQRTDSLAPVSVVVGAPVVALDLRRRLAERGAFAGTHFTPLSRMIELFGPPEAGTDDTERRPLTKAALGAALRVGLHQFPGVLRGVRDHRATEESLAQTYRLVRPLEVADRRRIASMSERARDVMRIVEAAREVLEPGWYDLDDLARSAAERIEKGEVDLADVGPVIVHLPRPLGPAELALLGVLARRGDVTVLVGIVGDEAADRASRAVVESLGRIGYDTVGEDSSSQQSERRREHRHLFARGLGAPDLEEEVRMALRLLVAHGESERQLGRTAVAFPGSRAGEAYASVIEELFSGAGMPWTGPVMTSLGETGQGKLLVDLVHLLIEGAGGFERSSVIRWLSSAGLSPACRLLGGLSSVTSSRPGLLAVGAFDRCSRAAGVVGGIEEWRSRLGAYGRRDEERARSGAPPSVARDLARILERLARMADELRSARSWGEVSIWAVKVVEQVVAGDGQEPYSQAMSELSFLDGLEELASPAATGAARLRWEGQLTSAVEAVLSRPAPRHGRFGVGPVIGTLSALAGIRTDLLIVLGASEGVLPGRTADDPLVTEIERDVVSALKDGERAEERDRRAIMTLLAGAATAVVTYPRVSRGATRPSHRSRWLSGDLYEGEFEEVASFSAAVAAVANGDLAPADRADLEMALIHRGFSQGRGIRELVVSHLDDLSTRLDAEQERKKGPLNRFGGLIGPLRDDSGVFGEVMSATRMQSLASCPLQFMFERLARIDILDAPDRRHMIEPRDRGSLIHAILEDFVEATVIGTEGFDGWDNESFKVLQAITDRHFDSFESRGLTGKAVYWAMAKGRIRADLERFVAIESERLCLSRGRPIRTEMAFGYGQEVPAVVITNVRVGDSSGRAMRFRGKIDRIDVEPGGVVRVVDYKSGSAASYGGIDKDPLERGRQLQLPIYAKAARSFLGDKAASVIAEFRFCSSEAGFKRLPVELTPELDDELGRVLGVLGDTIARGAFPPRPGNGDELQPANCRHCDYDSICRLDRGSLWQQASMADSMAPYVALVQSETAP